MERMVSTSRFLLWSVTVVFLVRTLYTYLMERHEQMDSVRKKVVLNCIFTIMMNDFIGVLVTRKTDNNMVFSA